ncbi:MAG: methoxymalonyl-ACP biosynthesis protein [Rhodospirillales bacterium]|nr:methoxymalonyl-ACP biosynthesis protein [Rhodospirillales bacterium]
MMVIAAPGTNRKICMDGSGSLDLHWLAPHPALRPAIKAAQASLESDAAKSFADLRLLAGHRLDFLTTMQVDRLADAAFRAAPAMWPEIRLAMLGASSMEHLRAPIRVAGARRGLQITPFIGGFGRFRQELIQPDSQLHAFKPDVLLLSLRTADVIERLPLGTTSEQVDAAVAAGVQSLVDLWRIARTEIRAAVIQQTFLNTDYPVFGNFDGAVAASSHSITDRLNRALRDAAAIESVMLLDVALWSAVQGLTPWYDPVRWHHAKQLIAPSAAVFYGDLIGRLLAAMRGLSAKCLVLDLDNTLWGGVIGDDGLNGIVLGQGSGAGEAFIAFQAYAKLLSQRGVILAVCSKNTHEIAEAVFLDHPDMVLKREDIAAFVANWNDKPSNLREIARTLNIGIDSLVFFDDNPAEREIVRQILPEVAVPEVPEDAAHFVSCLAEAGYFEAIAFTEEDRARAGQYRANSERSQVMQSGTDTGAFLTSLDMKMTVAPFTTVDLPRITQLANKSNQFNLTTRRYTHDQMAAFAASATVVTLSFRLVDKFGDNGLIGVLIALPDAADSQVLRIDTWLMSCRVLGRQVEAETINQLYRIARDRGFTTLVADYIPTSKNGLVRDIYARMGFTHIAGDAGSATQWSLPVADFQPTETAIAVDAQFQLQAAE